MSYTDEIDKRVARARKLVDKVDDPRAFKALDAVMQVLELLFMDVMPHGTQIVSQEQYAEMVKDATKRLLEQKQEKSDTPKAGVVPVDKNGKRPDLGGGLYL